MINQLADKLSLLPPDKWRTLSCKMAWVYRRPTPAEQLAELPREITRHHEGMLTQAEWNAVKRKVLADRRYEKAEAERQRLKVKAVQRQAYMRKYMKSYRRHKKAGT